MDITSVLPPEVFVQVTSFLDVTSLLRTRCLNKKCYDLCAKDQAGWTNLCEQLWSDKIFVTPTVQGLDAMTAYRLSVHDATRRHSVHEDEFCFIPETETGPIWDFRFKEAAGPDWTSWDPWWSNREARRMVFLQDGTLKQYFERDTEYEHDLLLRNPRIYGTALPRTGNRLVELPVSMTWRFCQSPMDLPKRERGSYIRISVGGRDVPTYCVRRSPTGNWGFLAESCWGVYTSFDMPKRAPPKPEDSLLVKRIYSVLCEDANFLITNEVQWREALLYNFGATVLPEGDTATEDFVRMFGQQLGGAPLGGAQVGGAAPLGVADAGIIGDFIAPPGLQGQQLPPQQVPQAAPPVQIAGMRAHVANLPQEQQDQIPNQHNDDSTTQDEYHYDDDDDESMDEE